ncbi:MAG: GNAT family N-acetyltransferase [Pseudomonadota bacterium]
MRGTGAPGNNASVVLALATERASDPAFCISWQALVAGSASPQKIYQTPAFFAFLQGACKGDRLELLTMTRLSDGVLVGVVPVRVSRQALDFQLGPLCLHRAKVEMINLLGSIPAVPPGAAVAGYLADQLLALFPNARAVFMQALPADSVHYADLKAIRASGAMLATSLMRPWQQCYTIPLPATFDLYLDQFSAKKRYNLNRQIRQLSAQVGKLELERIVHPGQVAGMMAALAKVASSAEMRTILSEKSLTRLAGQQLLQCYVMRAEEQVLAVIVGLRAFDTLHIDNIFAARKYLMLSVGTSAMHLAIKDAIAQGGLTRIDFGYGTPNNEFRSTHVLETRSQVLLFDCTGSISLLFFVHRHVVAVAERVIGLLKALRKRRLPR